MRGETQTFREFTKANLFGIDYALLNYEMATEVILEHAKNKNSYGVSALAVHGLMESRKNERMKLALSKIDMITPDGQPIKWALNQFHNAKLKDRVYGPKLTEYVINACEKENVGIYLYGSTEKTLNALIKNLKERFPKLILSGVHIDRYRDANHEEDLEDIKKINESGAGVVLVGRGCPRQEIWVGEHISKINAAMMAVGAAFDFHAGTLKQAPSWMQKRGLEWFYRLLKEPKRLWKRYLTTNSKFVYLYLRNFLKSGN